jgi:hypothetical protein
MVSNYTGAGRLFYSEPEELQVLRATSQKFYFHLSRTWHGAVPQRAGIMAFAVFNQ